MTPFNDEQLMAYADGELAAAEHAAVEAAVAADPALAARVERFRAGRRLLKQRFDAVAEAPVPQALLDLLQAPAARDKVVPLRPRASAPAAAAPRRTRPVWPMALAASLLLALGLAGGGWLLRGPGAVAADPLVAVLEQSPSGELRRAGEEEFLVLASLASADGRWCREYERGPAGGAMQRGLACRDADGGWQQEAVPPAAPVAGDGGYQLAGAGDDPAAAPGARRLDAAEEAARIAAGWR